MLYFTNEFQSNEKRTRTAGVKARDDIVRLFRDMHAREIEVVFDENGRKKGTAVRRFAEHIRTARTWDAGFRYLQKGDCLFLQFPVFNHSIFLKNSLRKLKKRGVRTVILLHDLELFRLYNREGKKRSLKLRIRLEEMGVLEECDSIIVHNESMKDVLAGLGIEREKMYPLGIFDYLIPDFEKRGGTQNSGKENGVIIAGNLRRHKAGYAYHLPTDCRFNLYGVGYDAAGAAENVQYFGSFDPEELPFVLTGSFGLVWDGDETETCAGAYGTYLRMNNPHKTSLYLAAGIPVAIWEEAALADFVKEHGCGLTIRSIEELAGKIEALSEAEYEKLKENAEQIGSQLRSGYYTREVVRNILQDCGGV